MTKNPFLRRHPTTAYFILAFGISWIGAFLLVAPRLFRGQPIPKMDGLLMFPLMLLGPAIAGTMLTRILDGAAGIWILIAMVASSSGFSKNPMEISAAQP